MHCEIDPQNTNKILKCVSNAKSCADLKACPIMTRGIEHKIESVIKDWKK